MNLKKIVILICIIWTSIVLLWTLKSEYTLHIGKTVLLKTIPVDPRDILMGDYVILNYEISRVPGKKFYGRDMDVYVSLKTDKDNIASIDRISTRKIKSDIVLKAHVGKCDTIIPLWKNGTCLKYGIESYYVKEGEGQKLEKDLEKGALVEVNIDRFQNAKVKGFVKI